MKVLEFFKRLFRKRADGGLRHWLLPAVAAVIVLISVLSGRGLAVEIEPGEVAVVYNNTGWGVFGEDTRVVTEQGVVWVFPWFQRVEVLDIRPQIFVMEGDTFQSDNHVEKLTVRAKDGSNFYFDKVTIHYQIIPGKADEVIRQNGLGDAYKTRALKIHAREVLRNEFGRYSFEEIANPTTYGAATSAARRALNERLNPLGIEVTNIPPPKPQFEPKVEAAIEARQNAETEVSVQEERRKKLLQESARRVQFVEQKKSAEYQQLLADLEARKKQAQNKAIATRRDADKYVIERVAQGQALRDEMVARAKANEVALRKDAEGLVAKIKAVGEQGPDVLNREIAEHVFPQLEKLKAVPYAKPATPMGINMTEGDR